MKVFAAIIFAGLTLAACGPVPYTNCGSASDRAKIANVSVVPFPPVAGQDMTMALTLAVGTGFTVSSYNVKGIYEGSTYVDHTANSCQPDTYPLPIDPDVQWVFSGFNCPVNTGLVTLNGNLTLSSLPWFPPGDFEIKVTAVDGSMTEIFCLDVQLTL